MKKADWLIFTVLTVMGLSCLIISASSFRGLSLHQLGLSVGQACLSMIVIAAVVGMVYWFTQRNKPKN